METTKPQTSDCTLNLNSCLERGETLLASRQLHQGPATRSYKQAAITLEIIIITITILIMTKNIHCSNSIIYNNKKKNRNRIKRCPLPHIITFS